MTTATKNEAVASALPLISDEMVLATELSAKAVRLQVRVDKDPKYEAELCEQAKAGDEFPAVECVTDGATIWLVDGNKRLNAAKAAGKSIRVKTYRGTRTDAIARACGANASHGLHRTTADKEAAVQLAIKTFPNQGPPSIAKLCCVSADFVRSIHPAVNDNGNSDAPQKLVGQDGKRYPVTKKRRKGISGGTSFSPAEIEAAPVKTPEKPSNGRPTVSTRRRSECLKLHGQFCRALNAAGIYSEFVEPLSQIAERLKQI